LKDGTGTAQFDRPNGIAIDPQGAFALVAVRASGPYPKDVALVT
jgi:DNA-binding beta-propeller fold protein YncE